MADLPPYPGTPRWAKVFGIIALIVVLLFGIRLFTRGPHRGHGDQKRLSSLTEDGVRQR